MNSKYNILTVKALPSYSIGDTFPRVRYKMSISIRGYARVKQARVSTDKFNETFCVHGCESDSSTRHLHTYCTFLYIKNSVKMSENTVILNGEVRSFDIEVYCRLAVW